MRQIGHVVLFERSQVLMHRLQNTCLHVIVAQHGESRSGFKQIGQVLGRELNPDDDDDEDVEGEQLELDSDESDLDLDLDLERDLDLDLDRDLDDIRVDRK